MPTFFQSKFFKILFLLLAVSGMMAFHDPCDKATWGFYGHRLINRKAVFTLPQEMIGFYKKHVEFVTEHAVDPDKRRYAIKQEATRHYIDIDHWGEYPFDNVPREYPAAFWKFCEVDLITDTDTIHLGNFCADNSCYEDEVLHDYFEVNIYPDHGDDSFSFAKEEFNYLSTKIDELDFHTIVIHDEFSKKGLLPYFFTGFYSRLISAMKIQDTELILKYSAEIGHYVGDAHVPLHTTENYNGQLTNQLGIHAFWESRIPELFAEGSYDFFVGRAEYIPDMKEYIWDVILESNQLVDSVLLIEKRLQRTFPEEKQYCFDERLDNTIRIQCPEYAAEYQRVMQGMVELRMQDAIKSLGSVWFSAWIEAGSPDLNLLDLKEESAAFKKEKDILEEKFKEGNAYGREHGG